MASIQRPDNLIDLSNGATNTYLVEGRHGLIPQCVHCRKFRPVLLEGNAYYAYFMRGASLDQAFPYLNADQREILISGTHPECWNAIFGDEDETEEDD